MEKKFPKRQKVILNGEESFSADLLSGIPQESVPGPALFLVILMIYRSLSQILSRFSHMIGKFIQQLVQR